MLERFFKLSQNNTTVRTEVLAGVTTFMTMSYIIFVNPSIMRDSGMPFDAVMVATCLASALATIIMGLYANYPIGLAPSMGINAFFTYGLVITMGYTWQVAMAMIFIEGVLFVLLTGFSIRTKILNAIPAPLKVGISVGIGLFLILIGLENSQLIVAHPKTLVTMGSLHKPEPLLAIFGFIITAAMYIKRIRGSILLGILITTVLAIFAGVTKLPDGVVSMPPSISPILWQMDFSLALTLDFIIIVLVLLFMDIFNTAGTLIGVAHRSGMLDKDGNLPRAKEAFMADAIGTTGGAVLGVTTVTAYIESVTGVEEGGRTGLAAVVIGLLFLVAMFFYPIVAVVPACATAPALIFVGMLMASVLKDLKFKDWSDDVPAIITMVMMPFTYNIATGIELGVISYALIKVMTNQAKKVSILIYSLAVLFIIKEIFVQF